MEYAISNRSLWTECSKNELYDINGGAIGFWPVVGAVAIVVAGVCIVCFVAGCAYEAIFGY